MDDHDAARRRKIGMTFFYIGVGVWVLILGLPIVAFVLVADWPKVVAGIVIGGPVLLLRLLGSYLDKRNAKK
jgi:hypothetical protein